MSKRNKSNEDIQIYLDSINREEDTAGPIQIDDDNDDNNNKNDDDDDDDEEASVVLVQAKLGKKRKILSDPSRLPNKKLAAKVTLTKITHVAERKVEQGPKAGAGTKTGLGTGAGTGAGAGASGTAGPAKAAGAVEEKSGKSDSVSNEPILPNNVKVKKEIEDPAIIILSDTVNETRVSKRTKRKTIKVLENLEATTKESANISFEFNEKHIKNETHASKTNGVSLEHELETDDDIDLDTENVNSSNSNSNTNETLHPVAIIKSQGGSSKDKDKGPFQCPKCAFSSPKKYLLSRHIKTHSDEKPFLCPICDRHFKSKFILQSHLNIHLGKKPYVCTHCTKAFTTNGELTRHTRYKHTGEKPHKCTECDYATVEMSKLRRHMRSHTGERPYQCPHCTYASPDTFKLKRHMRTHTGEKPYECDICQARFTQSNSLKSHRLIHNVGEKPVFKCSYCPTTCGRKRDLYTHVLILHNTDKPVTCKRCGKTCQDRYNYKLHVRTHQGEKCYRCRYCPYASVLEKHVESHMLIHTDEKPFTCQICDQSFRQNQLLKRHINLYHNKNYVKPEPKAKAHSCPKCKRSYTHKGNLMRHMETHDPESKIKEEKEKLMIGRKTKVNPDGTISAPEDAHLPGYTRRDSEITNEDYEHGSQTIDFEENADEPNEKYDDLDYMHNDEYDDDMEDVEVDVDHADYGDDDEIEKPITIEIEDENESLHGGGKHSITATVKVKKEKITEASGDEDDTECLAVQDEDGTKYIIYTITDGEDADDNERLKDRKKKLVAPRNSFNQKVPRNFKKVGKPSIRFEAEAKESNDYQSSELPDVIEVIEAEE